MAKKAKTTFKLSRTLAIKIFEYFEFKAARKWGSDRMAKKLSNLSEVVDVKTCKSKKVQELLKQISVASTIVVESEKTKPAPQKATEKKVGKIRVGKKVKKVTKDSKKRTTKMKKGKKEKSNKLKVYHQFAKVKPDKAMDLCEKWWEEETGKQVKLTTVRSWVSQWKRGKGLPSGIE